MPLQNNLLASHEYELQPNTYLLICTGSRYQPVKDKMMRPAGFFLFLKGNDTTVR